MSPSSVSALIPTNDRSQAVSLASSCTSASPPKFTRMQRERIVSPSWSGWTLNRMNTVRSGGSSSVLRKALYAGPGMRSAPPMIATL